MTRSLRDISIVSRCLGGMLVASWSLVVLRWCLGRVHSRVRLNGVSRVSQLAVSGGVSVAPRWCIGCASVSWCFNGPMASKVWLSRSCLDAVETAVPRRCLSGVLAVSGWCPGGVWWYLLD